MNDAFAAFLRKNHDLDVPVGAWIDVHPSWDPSALARRFEVFRVQWQISTTANCIFLWVFAYDEVVRFIGFDTPNEETGEEPYTWVQQGDPLPFEDVKAVRRVLKRKDAQADLEGYALLEAVLGRAPHPLTLLAQPTPIPTPAKKRSKIRAAGTSPGKPQRRQTAKLKTATRARAP